MHPMMYCSPVTVPMMVCQAPPMQFFTRRPPSLTILAVQQSHRPRNFFGSFQSGKEIGALSILSSVTKRYYQVKCSVVAAA